MDPVIEANIHRQREQSDPHQARLDYFEVLVGYHGLYLGRLEGQHQDAQGPFEPQEGLFGDRLTRLERLVELNEDRVRRLTSNLNRHQRYLELRGANPQDPSSRLDSLEQLLHNHAVWINHLGPRF
jgi:hypothetical protein